MDEVAQCRVLRNSDDETLDGRDDRREGQDLDASAFEISHAFPLLCHALPQPLLQLLEDMTHTTSLVLLTGPVRVLEQRVEDTADTEGRLDDVGNELADYTSVDLSDMVLVLLSSFCSSQGLRMFWPTR